MANNNSSAITIIPSEELELVEEDFIDETDEDRLNRIRKVIQNYDSLNKKYDAVIKKINIRTK